MQLQDRLLVLLSFSICISFSPVLRCQTIRRSHSTIEASEGTVNVFIGNRDALVVVTDSMLTYTNPERHEPTGVKLFKLDEKTVCTMAGLYSATGAGGAPALAAVVPNIIDGLIKRSGISTQDSLATKAETLLDRLQFALTANLQASIASDPHFDVALVSPLQITVAGYDVDGAIKLITFDLSPAITRTGAAFLLGRRLIQSSAPTCEYSSTLTTYLLSRDKALGLVVNTPHLSLFCAFAGLTYIPEQTLSKARPGRDNLILSKYAEYKSTQKPLTLDEIHDLALYLAKRTEWDEVIHGSFRVGGSLQVATLSGGMVIPNNIDHVSVSDAGSALEGSSFRGEVMDCGPSRRFGIEGRPTGDMEVEATNCLYKIDGYVVHDSIFIDSDVILDGGMQDVTIFAPSNSIVNTSLRLGESVNIDELETKHLMCDFPWVAVYRGSNRIRSLGCSTLHE